jgi:predicted DNA-binding transcriptional regulator AlpA
MSNWPATVDWKGLKQLFGWCYSRAHTWRLMKDTITVSEKVKGQKKRVSREIPNPDPFPRCFKLTSFPNAHPVWRTSEVLAYYEAHGLKLD